MNSLHVSRQPSVAGSRGWGGMVELVDTLMCVVKTHIREVRLTLSCVQQTQPITLLRFSLGLTSFLHELQIFSPCDLQD